MDAFEFAVERRALLEAVEAAQRVEAMAWIEAYDHANVRIDAMAMNGSMAVSRMVPVPHGVRGSVGSRPSVSLSSTTLRNVLNAITCDTVRVRRVRDGEVEVLDEVGSTFRLVTGAPAPDPAETDPAIRRFQWASGDKPRYTEIDADVVAGMIERTKFAISTDETRIYLNGCLFESSGTVLRMVATDGHRLSRVEFNLPQPIAPFRTVIPRRCVKSLALTLLAVKTAADRAVPCDQVIPKQLGMAMTAPYWFLQAGGTTLAVRTEAEADSFFPPYDQVIPKQAARRVEVDRVDLLGRLTRIRALMSRFIGVRLRAENGRLVLEGYDEDRGYSRCSISCAGTGVTERLVNADYVFDLVASMASERVSLEFNDDPLDPICVRDLEHAHLGVIMPMRDQGGWEGKR